MLKLKQLCALYQGISCSSKCLPGTCYPDLTEVAGYVCNCKGDWTGPTCEKAIQWSSIQSVLDSVPTLVAYWPLTRDFEARDATTNQIDGIVTGTMGSMAGPSGLSDSALQTASSGPNYITFSSTKLNFGERSWTIAGYVKTLTANIMPLFEYFDEPNSAKGATLWQYNAVDNIFSEPSNSDGLSMPCKINNMWQFVAVVYDNSRRYLRLFCNDSFYSSSKAITMTALSTNILYMGHRDVSVTGSVTADASFACASVFSSALNGTQLGLVKTLCPLYQGIKCSQNCLPGTCRVDLPSANGYNCTCSQGWIGDSCENPVCTSPCMNNGTCTAPDNCTCTVDWTGSTCAIPLCSPTCKNGGTCTSPNVCSCAAGWNGTSTGCNNPICSVPCQHSGNCSAPNTCSCPPSWTGSTCSNPVCSPSCQNGGTCTAPDTCTCSGISTGQFCDTFLCSPICKNGGNCTAAGTCICPATWSGTSCTIPVCSQNCQNGGTCSAPENCTCPGNWTGTFCEIFICSPKCKNGGTCKSGNVCECASGWEASASGCITPICTQVCANGGNCTAPDTCSCLAGWSGPTCTTVVPTLTACEIECSHCTKMVETASNLTSINYTLCFGVRHDFSQSCLPWSQQGNCLSNAAFMWTTCQASCVKYATCECDVEEDFPIDRNCTCGDIAALGLCETDVDIRTNCTYSCARRLDPRFYCSRLPLGVTLPPNANWSLTPPGLKCFLGYAAYLQSAVMVCNKGFISEFPGNTGMHTCDPFTPNAASGNWAVVNPNTPNCIHSACNDPPVIAGAYYVNQTNATRFQKGDKVTYSCNEGHDMTGAVVPEAECTFLGETGWTWHDKEPQCVLPPCQGLVEGVNTFVKVSVNHTGGVATYSCLKGYEADSDMKYFVKKCNGDGSWSPEGIPRCSAVTCGPPPEEDHASLNGTKPGRYNFADAVTVVCENGARSLYIEPGSESKPLGFVVNTCLETGFWSTNTLACLLVDCPYPQSFEISNYRVMNSSAEVQNLLYGDILALECDWNQGFEPAANQTNTFAYWRCNENSTWDKQPLACSQNSLLAVPKVKPVIHESASAVAAATTVLGVLMFFLGIIVCLDYMTLPRDLRRLRHNWRHFTRRLRDAARAKELHEIRTKIRNQFTKEQFLKKLEADRERKQMAAAGMLPGSNIALIPNPLSAPRPMSADGASSSRQHVEGEMELPENVVLRFGLQEHGDANKTDK